jgi:zinc/manganese transport system ATP-binding protein
MTAAAFRLDDVTLGYDGHPAVHHLKGVIAAGSLTAVFGSNGSGKSTLLKGLMGALKPMSGRIERVGFAAHDIAYLPQAADIDRNFPATVGDLVTLGLWRRAGAQGRITREASHEVMHALEAVGLSGFEGRNLATLSGGQAQRALFARVLVQQAKIILLDEPFTAIDAKTVTDLLALLRRWHAESRTIIAVLHDAHIVHEHFPDAILLAREQIAWGKTKDVLREENLNKARNMTEAWDEHAHWCAPETERV